MIEKYNLLWEVWEYFKLIRGELVIESDANEYRQGNYFSNKYLAKTELVVFRCGCSWWSCQDCDESFAIEF